LTASETKTLGRGYVHVYTGDGKGKTTAALGLAVRAAGHEIPTFIQQFMKGTAYGELTALDGHPYIHIEQCGGTECIRRDEVNDAHRFQARKGLKRAQEAMLSGRYGIVVLDEVNVAIWFDLVPEADVLELLAGRPKNVEVVLTGRNATDRVVREADLVTDFRQVKHYYQRGILARDGIER
jgi:cob(I)alamin adenosyltransferase